MVTIAQIKIATANHFKMTVFLLTCKRRRTSVVRPRQIAMYLAVKHKVAKLAEIGRQMGHDGHAFDHTTVLHSVRRIEQLIATDDEVAQDVRNIERRALPHNPKEVDPAIFVSPERTA